MQMLPYARQNVSAEDVAAVAAALRSDFLTQGPAVPRFEARVAELCGARHAIAVSSATAGLHLACLSLGLGPGKTLWTSPNTFVASANCARYCGAEVDFVDVELDSGNLSVAALREKFAHAARANRLPAVLVPVHFAGLPCDMAEIAAVAREHGVAVIEDAAHALGATYRGAPVGDGRFSDCTVLSFHAVKIATTGEGGVILTNRDDLAAHMRRLRTHGITREPDELTTAPEGPWSYEQVELGFHYRLTDIQAALGASQLSRLPEFLRRRRELAARYDALLRELPVRLPARREERDSSWHLYPICLDPARCPRGRREVYAAMRAAGIGVNVHYIPVHLQPYYRRLGFKPGDFPAAEARYAVTLTLPLFFGLTEAQQDSVVGALRATLA
ncbi:MAG TPA: UDP-4-amino-4,6-dideoxy-N-acetyl-beta-L-altrosamine transaminase [Opitutaceae bacterium]|nr:UDP-4-amino-4,6-dideoxy-N-acetyl-beta-L-altrosamine transaminase [Opitutaceae bacterium]